jgi:hypothetical protein
MNIIQHINRSNDNNHIIINICRKGLDKIQLHCMIRAPKKPGIEGSYLNITKA